MCIEYEFKGYDYTVVCDTCGKTIGKGNTSDKVEYTVKAVCKACGFIECHVCYDKRVKKDKTYKPEREIIDRECPKCRAEEQLLVERWNFGFPIRSVINFIPH